MLKNNRYFLLYIILFHWYCNRQTKYVRTYLLCSTYCPIHSTSTAPIIKFLPNHTHRVFSVYCMYVHNLIPLITCNQSPNRICLNISFVPLLIHIGLRWKIVAYFYRFCSSLFWNHCPKNMKLAPENDHFSVLGPKKQVFQLKPIVCMTRC